MMTRDQLKRRFCQGRARLLVSYRIDENGLLTVEANSDVDNHSEVSHNLQHQSTLNSCHVSGVQVVRVYSQDGRIPRDQLPTRAARVRVLKQGSTPTFFISHEHNICVDVTAEVLTPLLHRRE